MSDTAIAQTNNSLDEAKPSADPKADTPNDIKDNGDAQPTDESTPAKKAKLANDVNDETPNDTSAPVAKPGRQKSAKRLNILEKTAKEAEALLQNMGHKPDEDDGRRRTRSQTRGTPAPSVVSPAAKRATTPKTPTKESSSAGGTPKRRGRPPKNAVNNNNSVESKTEEKSEEPSDETPSESSEKPVNNTNETNNTNDATAAKPEATEEQSKESSPVKPSAVAAETTATTEQTKEVSAKANSISADTSNSAPVLDTQQPAKE